MLSPLWLHVAVFDQWLILSTSEQECFHYETKQTKPWMHIAFLPKTRKKVSDPWWMLPCTEFIWTMNFHVKYLASAIFRKIAQERTSCKMTWPTRADWCSLMRTKYFFLFQKTRRMKWIIKIRSDRAFQNLFSVCALIQHARQPDVTQNTARELLDRFMLWVVYCSCIMFMCSTSDSVAGNTCFRGQTN